MNTREKKLNCAEERIRQVYPSNSKRNPSEHLRMLKVLLSNGKKKSLLDFQCFQDSLEKWEKWRGNPQHDESFGKKSTNKTIVFISLFSVDVNFYEVWSPFIWISFMN